MGDVRMRAGDFAITPNGNIVQVLCGVSAVEVLFDDDSTAIMPIEALVPCWDRAEAPQDDDE